MKRERLASGGLSLIKKLALGGNITKAIRGSRNSEHGVSPAGLHLRSLSRACARQGVNACHLSSNAYILLLYLSDTEISSSLLRLEVLVLF